MRSMQKRLWLSFKETETRLRFHTLKLIPTTLVERRSDCSTLNICYPVDRLFRRSDAAKEGLEDAMQDWLWLKFQLKLNPVNSFIFTTRLAFRH
jgi:hypothetical protein